MGPLGWSRWQVKRFLFVGGRIVDRRGVVYIGICRFACGNDSNGITEIKNNIFHLHRIARFVHLLIMGLGHEWFVRRTLFPMAS